MGLIYAAESCGVCWTGRERRDRLWRCSTSAVTKGPRVNANKPSFLSRLSSLFSRPPAAQSLYDKALVLAKKGKLDDAIAAYSKVLRIDAAPANLLAMSHLNRALAYSSKRENGPARKDLEAVLAMKNAPVEVRKMAEEKLVKLKRRLGIKD